MKTVAFVPIKRVSKRVKGKNFRDFMGVPLYEWFLRKLIDVDLGFDAVYVDTDSDEIAAYAERNGLIHFPRLPELAQDTANGNHLLVHEAEAIEADIYCQLFITAPFLRQETIAEAVRLMREDSPHDSVFTAVKRFSWFWFDNKAVNYDPRTLPRSQDARPIIQETTGLYAIERSVLLADRCRIGRNPHMLFVDEQEAVDIDSEIEFRLAEFWHQATSEG